MSRHLLRRAVDEAMNRTGMIVGLPKCTVDAGQLRNLLDQCDAAEAEVARLKEGMIEIADALCVPFPDLAAKDEIIEQVAHHLDSLATSETESEIARKAAEAELLIRECYGEWCGKSPTRKSSGLCPACEWRRLRDE